MVGRKTSTVLRIVPVPFASPDREGRPGRRHPISLSPSQLLSSHAQNKKAGELITGRVRSSRYCQLRRYAVDSQDSLGTNDLYLLPIAPSNLSFNLRCTSLCCRKRRFSRYPTIFLSLSTSSEACHTVSVRFHCSGSTRSHRHRQMFGVC